MLSYQLGLIDLGQNIIYILIILKNIHFDIKSLYFVNLSRTHRKCSNESIIVMDNPNTYI